MTIFDTFTQNAAVRWLIRLETTEDVRFGERPTIEWVVRPYVPLPNGERLLGPGTGFGRRLAVAYAHATSEARRRYGAARR